MNPFIYKISYIPCLSYILLLKMVLWKLLMARLKKNYLLILKLILVTISLSKLMNIFISLIKKTSRYQGTLKYLTPIQFKHFIIIKRINFFVISTIFIHFLSTFSWLMHIITNSFLPLETPYLILPFFYYNSYRNTLVRHVLLFRLWLTHLLKYC